MTVTRRFPYAFHTIRGFPAGGILELTLINLKVKVRMENPVYLTVIKTDWLGLIGIAVTSRGLLRLRMVLEGREDFLRLNQACQDGEYSYEELETAHYAAQIRDYLSGKLRTFSLPIDWSGYTAFQEAVLRETLKIPYGETRSYGEIAAAVGKAGAARAVGQAEKRNQVPLVIPCHRVIGADGSLTGYGGRGNTELKARLLAFERGILV